MNDQINYRSADLIAAGMCRRLGATHLIEDAQSEARLALWRCSKKFDPSRGHSLMQYARRRIQGAVIDALRTEQYLDKHRNKPFGAYILPIDAAKNVPAVIPKTEHIDVMRALDVLPARQRYVVTRRYLDDADCVEISRELGVNKSRVSGILHQAYCRMRKDRKV